MPGGLRDCAVHARGDRRAGCGGRERRPDRERDRLAAREPRVRRSELAGEDRRCPGARAGRADRPRRPRADLRRDRPGLDPVAGERDHRRGGGRDRARGRAARDLRDRRRSSIRGRKHRAAARPGRGDRVPELCGEPHPGPIRGAEELRFGRGRRGSGSGRCGPGVDAARRRFAGPVPAVERHELEQHLVGDLCGARRAGAAARAVGRRSRSRQAACTDRRGAPGGARGPDRTGRGHPRARHRHLDAGSRPGSQAGLQRRARLLRGRRRGTRARQDAG